MIKFKDSALSFIAGIVFLIFIKLLISEPCAIISTSAAW